MGIQGSREGGVDVEGERARCASNSVQWATESGPASAISEPTKPKHRNSRMGGGLSSRQLNANLMRGTLATASQVTSMSDEMSWDVQ